MDVYTSLEKSIFRTDAAGNTVYYPWGMRRTGVIVPSEDDLKAIKNRTRKFYSRLPYILFLSILLIAIYGNSLLQAIIICIPIFLYFAVFEVATRRSIKNYQKTSEVFTYAELWRRNAKNQSLLKTVLAGILSLILLVYATYATVIENNYFFGFIAIPTSVFLIMASSVVIYMKLAAK